jgi:hypothetical protein
MTRCPTCDQHGNLAMCTVCHSLICDRCPTNAVDCCAAGTAARLHREAPKVQMLGEVGLDFIFGPAPEPKRGAA